jgi:20S proteasome alpha/beta subunit
MTYILGSHCKDGVVLVADLKYTMDYGASQIYERKLMSNLSNFVIGFSGSRGTFELFMTTVDDYMKAHQELFVPAGKGISSEKLILILSELIAKMNSRFRYQEQFDALVSMRSSTMRASLKYFYPDGRMETISTVKAIGTGAPYGMPFIAPIWTDQMTMEQVAELGYFIIKYIETLRLDHTVGIEDYDPTITFMPADPYKDPYIIERKPELLSRIRRGTEERIKHLREGLQDIYFRPASGSDD